MIKLSKIVRLIKLPTISGRREGNGKPIASFAAMWLPRSWENDTSQAHLGNQALRGGFQVRSHRQRHGRAQHRQKPDRPVRARPERQGDRDAERLLLLHPLQRPRRPDHRARKQEHVQLHAD